MAQEPMQHTPSVVARLYQPRRPMRVPPMQRHMAQSIGEHNPPTGTGDEASAPLITRQRQRWITAVSRIKAMIRIAHPVMRAWHGLAGWQDWRATAGRPRLPSSTLRQSSFDRFWGVAPTMKAVEQSAAEQSARPASAPRARTGATAASHRLPPVMSIGTKTTRCLPKAIVCCGTIWHDAAKYEGPQVMYRPNTRGASQMERSLLCSTLQGMTALAGA